MTTQTLSTTVTNLTSKPRGVINKALIGAPLICLRDTAPVPDTGNGDEIILGPLPVDAVIRDLEITFSDCGSAGTADVGLFKTQEIAGALSFIAVDKDCIADNLAISPPFSTSIVPARIAGLASDDVFKKAWEIAGLTARPQYSNFYFGITTDTGTTTTGSVSIDCTYTV